MSPGSVALAEFRPSRVGIETRAMRPCEVLESADDYVDAAFARVRQRSAAKRGKARSKDHAGVDEVRVRDDFLPQYRGALVGEREDQPVFQIMWRRGRRRCRLDRLAVAPDIKSLATLAPEFSGRDQRVEARGVGLLLVERGRHDL